MGQYYNIILKGVKEETVHTFDRTLDGEYTMAKLMEHSYYLNPMVNAIAKKIYNKPSQIAWVGDYANDNEELYNLAYHPKNGFEELKSSEFSLNGRYLINHTKKLILSCWGYVVDCIRNCQNQDYASWVIHPLPLLTALGNGKGGGDYRGINEDKVGSWAWDTLEIVEWEKMRKLKDKKGYQDYKVIFLEY